VTKTDKHRETDRVIDREIERGRETKTKTNRERETER